VYRQKNARSKRLKVKVGFEACRVTSACLIDAYEWIVPVHKRIFGTGSLSAGNTGEDNELANPSKFNYDFVTNSSKRRKSV